MRAVAHFTCCAGIVQQYATKMFEPKFYQSFLEQSNIKLKKRYQLIEKLLNEYEIPFYKPTAAMYVWIDLR